MSSEQTIRRGVRNARYAAIPNHVFEDDRLSMEARWLLGYLLSKPDNWTVVIGDITKRGNCGRDKARKMIAELVELGYAEREQVRDDGKFGASVLVIYDEPLSMQTAESKAETTSVAFLPQTDLPATAKPSPDSPSPVKSSLSNNSDLENTDCYEDERDAREIARKRHQALERGFWRLIKDWPDIQGMPHKNWLSAWLALTDDERERAERRRDVWLQTLKRQGRTKTYVPGTYLSEKLFDQVSDPTPSEIQRKNRVRVPPFGPAWTGLRMIELLNGPISLPNPEIDPREATRKSYETLLRANPTRAAAYLERKGVGLGSEGQLVFPPDFLDREERRREMAEGYPEVNRLHEAAAHGQSVETSADISRFQSLCEPVPVGSDMWLRWQEEHQRRNWQWVPDPGAMRIVYFPKGGPEGLNDFMDAAIAASSEAAE